MMGFFSNSAQNYQFVVPPLAFLSKSSSVIIMPANNSVKDKSLQDGMFSKFGYI